MPLDSVSNPFFDKIKPVRPFNKDQIPFPGVGRPEKTKATLHLDIGCGTGSSTYLLAQNHPQDLVVGIERTKEKIRKTSRHQADNLYFYQADAISWCVHYLPYFQLNRFQILYPNPEPKNRSQRWFRMPFMGHLIEHLGDQGSIHLATNIKSYYQEAIHYALNWWGLILVDSGQWKKAPRTAFEKKYLERGQTCYYMTLAPKPL
jgi:tRNA G46 methylase TrmB